MRIAVFDDFRVGVVEGPDVVDVSAVLPPEATGSAHAICELAAAFDVLRPAIEAAVIEGPRIALADVLLHAPVPMPRQIFAAGGNYDEHVEEMRASGRASWEPPPPGSWQGGVFLKGSGSVVGPQDAIALPDNGRLFHHEGELGVVIGREARGVSAADALGHVWGYVCLLDVTMRMSEDAQEDRGYRKSFDTFTPIGPWLATADEVGDPQDLRLRLSVSGEKRQDASTAGMVVSVAGLIESISRTITLHPGDVIATGTPEGVGPLTVGDEVEIEIEHVGRMALPVIARG